MADEVKDCDCSVDAAAVEMYEVAGKAGVSTAFDRFKAMQPQCKFGVEGLCCRHCAMGPCRIIKGKEGKDRGVCGATADTIAARQFARMVAAGTASHSDHARSVAEMFILAAEGKAKGYVIRDEKKLLETAMDLGVEIGDRPVGEIAKEIGEMLLGEFGRQHGELYYTSKAPLKRQELWRKQGIMPRGIDREVVDLMHRTHMGVDHDPKSLIYAAARTALADGWGGSMIATELQDIMFGTPQPVLGLVNTGVLKEKEINVLVHGHEPVLCEMIVSLSADKDILAAVKKVGAEGLNIVGMCCTANEMLMRHGLPMAGNFMQQELAITTGVVDAMLVDVQCIMPSLPTVAKCYSTKIITTSPKAKFPGATHVEFEEHNAMDSARKILLEAVDNYKNRKGDAHIPNYKKEFIAGFSHETINYLLGGMFRSSYKPLNDNIINGRIRGVAGVVGCNNPRVKHDDGILSMVRELIKNDVLVLATGCGAVACAKAGLCRPEAAKEFAGDGLASVCEAVGIPPVLHMGACVDNSRILIAATCMVKEGGLGDDLCDLPAVGAAPEWMSEKAIAIGHYFVASGVFTVFGATFPTLGAEETTDILFNQLGETFGGHWAYEPDHIKAAHLMIAKIDEKRKALGIDKARDRVLFDMEKRRELE